MSTALLHAWLYATVVLAALLVLVIAVQNVARLARRVLTHAAAAEVYVTEPARDLVRAA